MPWQTAPSYIIIGGAFNVAAGLMWGAQRLGYGEVCRCKGLDQFIAHGPQSK